MAKSIEDKINDRIEAGKALIESLAKLPFLLDPLLDRYNELHSIILNYSHVAQGVRFPEFHTFKNILAQLLDLKTKISAKLTESDDFLDESALYCQEWQRHHDVQSTLETCEQILNTLKLYRRQLQSTLNAVNGHLDQFCRMSVGVYDIAAFEKNQDALQVALAEDEALLTLAEQSAAHEVPSEELVAQVHERTENLTQKKAELTKVSLEISFLALVKQFTDLIRSYYAFKSYVERVLQRNESIDEYTEERIKDELATLTSEQYAVTGLWSKQKIAFECAAETLSASGLEELDFLNTMLSSLLQRLEEVAETVKQYVNKEALPDIVFHKKRNETYAKLYSLRTECQVLSDKISKTQYNPTPSSDFNTQRFILNQIKENEKKLLALQQQLAQQQKTFADIKSERGLNLNSDLIAEIDGSLTENTNAIKTQINELRDKRTQLLNNNNKYLRRLEKTYRATLQDTSLQTALADLKATVQDANFYWNKLPYWVLFMLGRKSKVLLAEKIIATCDALSHRAIAFKQNFLTLAPKTLAAQQAQFKEDIDILLSTIPKDMPYTELKASLSNARTTLDEIVTQHRTLTETQFEVDAINHHCADTEVAIGEVASSFAAKEDNVRFFLPANEPPKSRLKEVGLWDVKPSFAMAGYQPK